MKWIIAILVLSTFVLAQPVNYCNGCPYEDRCVSFNSQIKSPNGFLYCYEDSVLYPAKVNGMQCTYNYECLSFNCIEGICKPFSAADLEERKEIPVLVPVIVVGCLFLLGLLIFLIKHIPKLKFKAKPKKAKQAFKQEETKPSSPAIRILPIRKDYRQFEKLEEQLEETTTKLIRKK